MIEQPEWEYYANCLSRVKVDGGYLYQSFSGEDEVCMCFVPDVDLARYQSHLRDAYNQGLKDGQDVAHKQYSKVCMD